MTHWSSDEVPNLRIWGRTSKERQPISLFWTASGVELIFTGSELYLEYEADYDAYEPWIAVAVNGAWLTRVALTEPQGRLLLFRGTTPGTPKHVLISKETQAMSGDPRHALRITGFSGTDGEFLPVPEKPLVLEFVGDSITSGEGAIGAIQEIDWISAFFSTIDHYARTCSEQLDAEFRIVSQSGWGVVSGWDNNPAYTLLPHYTQIASLLTGPGQRNHGAAEPYDFAERPADAVILNLGTNDQGAHTQPPYVSPEGESYQQTLDDQGRPTAASAERFMAAVVEHLKAVRQANPDALIVWAYGMLGDLMAPAIQEAIRRYVAATGDPRIRYFSFPGCQGDDLGARQHPGAAYHRRCGKLLADQLQIWLAE